MTLHSKEVAKGYFKTAVTSPLNVVRLFHPVYILLNGYILKHCGVVILFVNGWYESGQGMAAMKKLLSRYGVDVIESKKGRFNILEGVLKN